MISLSLSRLSRPRLLAKSSSILVSVSTFTAFTVTSKVASLPARCSAWYSAGKVTVMVFFLTGLHAHQLFLRKAGDEGAGTQTSAASSALPPSNSTARQACRRNR